MALPTLFANLTSATGAQLDGDFAALGAITPIASTLSGTNVLVFTPVANTPTVTGYAQGLILWGVAAAANTGATTASTGSLAALPVYKDTTAGPIALVGGEIAAGNVVFLIYDAALASGAGGWHLSAVPMPATTTGSGNTVLATAPTLSAVVLTTAGYTVATLPTAATHKGQIAYVTDASVATASVGAALTGGGSNTMPVFCNGTAWVYG